MLYRKWHSSLLLVASIDDSKGSIIQEPDELAESPQSTGKTSPQQVVSVEGDIH